MDNMELHMKDSSTLGDIQAEFSQEYPFLKMDFLKPVKDRLGWMTGMEKILPGEKIFPFYRNTSINTVHIQSDKTVIQLIKEMEGLLGIKVMVQRKSGKVWIETTLTTDWTLEQQNNEGKFLSEIQ
jgi:hypothetical protein